MTPAPAPFDPTAALRFVINAGSGRAGTEAKRALIESALAPTGRRFEIVCPAPDELVAASAAAAAQALAERGAVIAVGGDGTLNTVAQAAHAIGCPLGVVPQGTFNYFARSHGIPADPADAVRLLATLTQPLAVTVAAVNDQVFLVNASVGLYPELLENREAYKARFGRSRWVALWAGAVTLLRAQRRLRLKVELGGAVRELRTLTLFVGQNRLQLEQFGVAPDGSPVRAPKGAGAPSMTAVVLKPIGTLSMLGLMLRGALGTLGEADSVERFEFGQMTVSPSLPAGPRGVKVAFDGEVARLRSPLVFHLLERPLYLLAPPGVGDAPGASR